MPYVPALDGLRALAMLLVVLFHCKLPVLVGGVGVDLFLVLSGFLLGSIADDIFLGTEQGYLVLPIGLC